MKKATDDLASVSEQLSAAPKLADTPRRLAELQITVADFGSQVGITFLIISKCYSTFRLEGLLGLEPASPGNTTRLRQLTTKPYVLIYIELFYVCCNLFRLFISVGRFLQISATQR